MASSSPKSEFWRGVRDGLPLILVIAPFALVFGVLATEAGLTVAQTLGFSALVIAGASQLAALQMMTEAAPFLIVVATALAVNLRMAMYSAALTPHLGFAPLWQRAVAAYLNVDQTYALSVARYDEMPGLSGPARLAYFLGTAVPVIPVWYGGTLAGALAGRLLPEGADFGFAVPIAFLSIVALMLRTRAHWIAAAVSVAVALALSGLPANTGLLIAAGAAMAAGAVAETWEARR